MESTVWRHRVDWLQADYLQADKIHCVTLTSSWLVDSTTNAAFLEMCVWVWGGNGYIYLEW